MKNFKSYTRKSSALTGADRAGIPRDQVVQNEEGAWGFYINAEPQKVANIDVSEADLDNNEQENWNDTTAELPPSVVFSELPALLDRRKVKREHYRVMRDIRKNLKHAPGIARDAVSVIRKRLKKLDTNKHSENIRRNPAFL